MDLTARLTRRWYGQGRRPWLARPLTWLYHGVVALRRTAYRRGWLRRESLPVPVLVIGNISVGGTGKTPLVIALVERLRALGWKPGVVSRGHGGSQREPALLPAAADPARFGDEPSLIASRTGVPVAVGRDRPAAARLLLDAGVDLVLSDDGLQHYRLARELEVCVIDGERGLGNGLMLPCGPLREPPSRLREVDFIVCNGGPEQAGRIRMMLAGDHARALDDAARLRPLSAFTMPVHAVAGIGNPSRFFASLRAHGLAVIEHAFPDHHAYVAGELDFGDGLPVLMTEKDAVKCAGLAPADSWSVPIDARLPEAFVQALQARLSIASDQSECRNCDQRG